VVAEGKLPRATSQKLWQSVREQGNWYLGWDVFFCRNIQVIYWVSQHVVPFWLV
jgi:hypothetical protein